MKIPPSQPNARAVDCLAGGGEMGALMRAYNWEVSALGPVSEWPQGLKTALGILLATGFSMYIAWGPEFLQFYNDAYRPILGATKHPKALGQSSAVCFAEIWEFIGPMFRRAVTTGEATSLTDQLLLLDRNGFVEECYFTFSYSAIPDGTGSYGGVLVTCIETTDKVLSERRVSTLREFATATAEARTTEQACQVVEKIVRRNPHDLPFTLLYLLDDEEKTARLAGLSGLEPGTEASPLSLVPAEQEVWPFCRVTDSETSVLVTELQPLLGSLLVGSAASGCPHSALVLPIPRPGHRQLAGFLVAGISARLPLDDSYRGYLDLLAGSVSTVIGSARAYESERRRAEALTELDQAKTAFFSNVSHEFRTPLTLILGRIEDILVRPEGGALAENRNALSTVHRNAQRLLKLVNTLLDFSRIEAGRVQAFYEPTDLSGYTAELASMFRSAIEKAGMQLLVHCTPLSEPVYVDREMWEKIVLNLLSNAFKFTEVGEIEVTMQERDGSVELIVRDTGTGISKEQLPHIFERFHRVEGARARTQEGTGIGLALVQELAKLQGGGVRVESVYGRGSAFTVSLPLGTAHLPHDRARPVALLPAPTSGARPYVEEALRWLPDQGMAAATAAPTEKAETASAQEAQQGGVLRSRILLADDNADMRDYVAGLLRPHYEVNVVSDGRQALGAIQAHPPDLLLSDVMMPGLDGFELIRAMRSDPLLRTIPVILLSARAGEEAQVEGLMAGADDYLIKPFGAKELRARVASHLELARTRKEAVDIKERFLTELRAERTRLTNLFMQAPAFMAVLRGPQHIFDMANSAYYQLVGHRDILGKTVIEALPELAGQGYIEILDEVYRTGTPFEGRFMRAVLQPKVGGPLEECYLDLIYQALVEADGSVSGILAHGVDLTERHRAESALQASQEQIEALNAKLRRAMTETHHRVKNNLQMISALIDMQRHTGAETVPMSDLAQLGQNIQALGIIHDILTKEAKSEGETEFISVSEVLERLLPILQTTLGARRLIAAIEQVSLPGKHTTSLALITNELVSNAVKHGKGDVELALRTDDNVVTLTVSDDGPGFPDGFDPEIASNTGLELIENIARYDLNGATSYENRAGWGARVVIAFPKSHHTGSI